MNRNGITTYAFYSQSGQLMGEYNSSGNPVSEYIYLGSRLVGQELNRPNQANVTVPPPNTVFLQEPIYFTWSHATTGSYTHYEIVQSTDPNLSSVELSYSGISNTYTHTAPDDPNLYYYGIRVCNGGVCSDYEIFPVNVKQNLGWLPGVLNIMLEDQ